MSPPACSRQYGSSRPFATGPLFEAEQERFELEHLFRDVPRALPDGPVDEVETANTKPAIDRSREIGPDCGSRNEQTVGRVIGLY